jgi:hypothetical protein
MRNSQIFLRFKTWKVLENLFVIDAEKGGAFEGCARKIHVSYLRYFQKFQRAFSDELHSLCSSTREPYSEN